MDILKKIRQLCVEKGYWFFMKEADALIEDRAREVMRTIQRNAYTDILGEDQVSAYARVEGTLKPTALLLFEAKDVINGIICPNYRKGFGGATFAPPATYTSMVIHFKDAIFSNTTDVLVKQGLHSDYLSDHFDKYRKCFDHLLELFVYRSIHPDMATFLDAALYEYVKLLVLLNYSRSSRHKESWRLQRLAGASRTSLVALSSGLDLFTAKSYIRLREVYHNPDALPTVTIKLRRIQSESYDRPVSKLVRT